MLNEKMLSALNKQINEEFASAYLYLSMAAYFESIDLNGFANWMRVQYQEESAHTMKIFDYVIRRSGKIELDEIVKPANSWSSPIEVFEQVLKHEQYISGCVNNLVKLSRDLVDNATEIELQWFVTEQVEEEENVQAILNKLKLVGDSGHGLLMIDAELGQRVFTPIVQP